MDSKKWAEDIFVKIDNKLKHTINRQYGKLPYVAIDGVYNDMLLENRICWWTNGFYGGILWQMYNATNDDIYKNAANDQCELLDRALIEYDGLHHDVGFMYLHTAGAKYGLTGDLLAKRSLLHASNLLAGRFNIEGNYLRAWNQDKTGWVIIDSMMNIPLLFLAAKELNDPRSYKIAKAHADTVLKYLVREDGSAGHIASFNAETGEFIEQLAGQGYSSNSAWSRGQSWAVYGFALAYRYTRDIRYLDAAKRLGYHFIANVSLTNFLPLVDFRMPNKANPKWDMSAAMCAVCGMLEIADLIESDVNSKEQTHVGEIKPGIRTVDTEEAMQNSGTYQARIFRDVAIKMLKNVVEAHADFSTDKDGIIQYCSHSYHQEAETHVSFIYADYFLTEAVLRLLKKDYFIW